MYMYFSSFTSLWICSKKTFAAYYSKWLVLALNISFTDICSCPVSRLAARRMRSSLWLVWAEDACYHTVMDAVRMLSSMTGWCILLNHSVICELRNVLLWAYTAEYHPHSSKL